MNAPERIEDEVGKRGIEALENLLYGGFLTVQLCNQRLALWGGLGRLEPDELAQEIPVSLQLFPHPRPQP